MTQVSPAWRETRTFNMHVQPLLLLIQRWPWFSSPINIKHGIWISGVCGSWTISQPMIYVAALAGGIGGCTITADDAKVAYKIWGDSVSRLKGGTVRETGQRKPQSLVKFPRELIQLQHKVRIGIDIFFVNGHSFCMAYSRMICFTTVTHLINH
jgi:hypothetical protein